MTGTKKSLTNNMLGLLACVLCLWSCSAKTPGEFFADLEIKNKSAEIMACREWVQQKELGERKQYDALQSRDMSFALMHRETMDMIKVVFGKNQNECSPGTNEYDAYIVYLKEKGATDRVIAQEVGSGVKTLAVAGAAGYVGGKLVDKVGDNVSGDKVSSGRDNVRTEGDVSLAGTTTQTTTSDKITQVQSATDASPNTVTKSTPAPEVTVIPAEGIPAEPVL